MDLFFQCFVSSVAHHQHTAEVTTLKWSGDGKQFCSGSLDGSIKVGRHQALGSAAAHSSYIAGVGRGEQPVHRHLHTGARRGSRLLSGILQKREIHSVIRKGEILDIT